MFKEGGLLHSGVAASFLFLSTFDAPPMHLRCSSDAIKNIKSTTFILQCLHFSLSLQSNYKRL